MIKKEKNPMASSVSMAPPAAYPDFQDPRTSLERGLQAWCDQEKNARAHQYRICAKKKIMDCYSSNSTALDLSSMQLTSLPQEMMALVNLEKLYVPGNFLTSIPSAIASLKNLRVLDLAWNPLTSIPPEIGQLENLQRLDSEQARLRSIPREIGALKNLKRLNLQSNELTSIPREIYALANLRTLDLTSNRLTSIPAGIGVLRQLRQLYLNHNLLLASLPPEIGALRNLLMLNLSYTQLERLPLELFNLTLCTIVLTNCPLSNEESGRIRWLTKTRGYPGPRIIDLVPGPDTAVPDEQDLGRGG